MRKSVVMLLLVLTACGQPVSIPVTPATAPPSATSVAVPASASTATFAITSAPTPSVPIPVAPQPSLTPALASQTPVVSSDITAWLSTHVIPFTTSDPNAPLDDLAPLKTLIGAAHVVALGEATHGTHEFFQMKHRLLEYLVLHMGFSVFAIEDQWGAVQALNSYIQTGQGDVNSAFRGLLAVWQTQEVYGILTWMRAYNTHVDPAHMLSFVGIDMQNQDQAIDYLNHYLQAVAPNDAQRITASFACVRGSMGGYRTMSEGAKTQCMQTVHKAYDNIAANRALYSQHSSPAEFVQALHAARIAVQATELYALNDDEAIIGTRDRLMAENVQWITDQAAPQAKVVVWAHNWHVRTGDCIDVENVPCLKSMGMYLREHFGTDLVAFGFDFYAGSFRTPSSVFHVLPPPQDSYVYTYHSTNIPRFFLDTRHLSANALMSQWLAEAHKMRDIGADYDAQNPAYYFEQVRLPAVFDVIIYFQDTTAAVVR